MSADSHAGGTRGDSLLSQRAKEAGRAVLAPVIRGLAAAGVGPNTITVIGLVIVGVGAALIATGNLLAGAVVLAVGAAFDAVDGGLARAQGGGTPFGAFLDSTLDRIGEAVTYLAIARLGLTMADDQATTVLLAVAALIGSLLVSYTRARAESLGFTASNGLAPRTERLVILVMGLVVAGLGYPPALLIALALIAILSWATVVQRIWHVHRQAAAAAPSPSIGPDKEH